MNGLHLIGDLTGCRCDPQLLLEGEKFRAKCVALVEASGLTAVGVSFHQFEGSGFTGCLVLAESHLAIHTWPERQGLTLDVYVCNYSADNSAKARKLFDSIVAYFKPTEVARHEVDRGEHLLTEPLNASTGFYIKASRQLGEWQTRFQKMQVLVEDGMKFVRDTQEKFDLAALDLNDPVGPAAALYSGEFFQQLRQTLAPGGALTLHLGSPVAQPQRVAELAQRLNSVFRIVRVYIMYIPLYGSLWSMAVCSDKLDPKAFTADEIDRRLDARQLQELKYYNGATHEGGFALPNYVRDLVTPARLKQPAA